MQFISPDASALAAASMAAATPGQSLISPSFHPVSAAGAVKASGTPTSMADATAMAAALAAAQQPQNLLALQQLMANGAYPTASAALTVPSYISGGQKGKPTYMLVFFSSMLS